MIYPLVFIFIAGLCKGMADLLQFHHDQSRFSAKVSPTSFFGSKSYLRKYRRNSNNMATMYPAKKNWYYRMFDVRYEEAFPLSATLLVGLTDAPHACNHLLRASVCTAILMTAIFQPPVQGIIEGVKFLACLAGCWFGGFFITYNGLQKH